MKVNQVNISSYLMACETLGVNPHAPLSEIKRNHRDNVKMYHPDRNNSSSAIQSFQQAQDAYELIVMFRLIHPDFDQVKTESSQVNPFKKWEHAEKKQRRSRVKEELKAEYQAGKPVGSKKKHERWERILLHINLLVVIVQWLVLPPLLFYYYGLDGIWMAVGVNVVGFFFTVTMLRNRKYYSWVKSLGILIKSLRTR
jgi:hypothetical protein